VIVATLSNGAFYLNKFLLDASGLPSNSNIIEVWDFDSDIATTKVNPNGKPLRAYWQGSVPGPFPGTYVHLPIPWANFPNNTATLQEVPPLPPLASNSNSAPDTDAKIKVHHYIRDTMFLDAIFNIENDNP
jgi:hypothetical protein